MKTLVKKFCKETGKPGPCKGQKRGTKQSKSVTTGTANKSVKKKSTSKPKSKQPAKPAKNLAATSHKIAERIKNNPSARRGELTAHVLDLADKHTKPQLAQIAKELGHKEKIKSKDDALFAIHEQIAQRIGRREFFRERVSRMYASDKKIKRFRDLRRVKKFGSQCSCSTCKKGGACPCGTRRFHDDGGGDGQSGLSPWVEIFASGQHQGQDYSSQQIDQAIRNFWRISVGSNRLFTPTAVAGHEEGADQEILKNTGVPAAGAVADLARKIDRDQHGRPVVKLLARFKDVVPEMVEVINQKRYRTVSAEFYEDFDDQGKNYGFALRRVAFLGGEIPEVKSLKDLPKFADGQRICRFSCCFAEDGGWEKGPRGGMRKKSKSGNWIYKKGGSSGGAKSGGAKKSGGKSSTKNKEAIKSQISELDTKINALSGQVQEGKSLLKELHGQTADLSKDFLGANHNLERLTKKMEASGGKKREKLKKKVRAAQQEVNVLKKQWKETADQIDQVESKQDGLNKQLASATDKSQALKSELDQQGNRKTQKRTTTSSLPPKLQRAVNQGTITVKEAKNKVKADKSKRKVKLATKLIGRMMRPNKVQSRDTIRAKAQMLQGLTKSELSQAYAQHLHGKHGSDQVGRMANDYSRTNSKQGMIDLIARSADDAHHWKATGDGKSRPYDQPNKELEAVRKRNPNAGKSKEKPLTEKQKSRKEAQAKSRKERAQKETEQRKAKQETWKKNAIANKKTVSPKVKKAAASIGNLYDQITKIPTNTAEITKSVDKAVAGLNAKELAHAYAESRFGDKPEHVDRMTNHYLREYGKKGLTENIKKQLAQMRTNGLSERSQKFSDRRKRLLLLAERVSRFCGPNKPGRCKKGETGVGEKENTDSSKAKSPESKSGARKKAREALLNKARKMTDEAKAKMKRTAKRTVKALFKGGTEAKTEVANAWNEFRGNLQTGNVRADKYINKALDGAEKIGGIIASAFDGWRKTAKIAAKNYRLGAKQRGGLASEASGAGTVLLGVAKATKKSFVKNYKKDLQRGFAPWQAKVLGAVQGISTIATYASTLVPGVPTVGAALGGVLGAVGVTGVTSVPGVAGLARLPFEGVFRGANALHKSMKNFFGKQKHSERFSEGIEVSAGQLIKIVKRRMEKAFRQAIKSTGKPAGKIKIPESLIAKVLTALTQGKSPFELAH